MNVIQQLYKNGAFVTDIIGKKQMNNPNTIVLGFGAKKIIRDERIYEKLKRIYTKADIILCSTAGEIYDDQVFDDTVSIVAIEFEKTIVKTISTNIKDNSNSFDAGKQLFNKLVSNSLVYILLISDGRLVNASELVRGIASVNINNIPVTGGLAADGDKFDSTLVGCNGSPVKGNIVAIGFYGNNLHIAHGACGGWDVFGPEKKVTRSISNRLFEIDNKSALELYKQYLGKYATDLPSSALLFPLSVREEGGETMVVRTIVSIDNNENSMIFAGDIPEGSYVRMMKANFDKIIDAATSAAKNSVTQFNSTIDQNPKLALLISCVGRKLILGKRIDEETEAIRNVFGTDTIISGFYSYGEISPLNPNSKCELQNQTMTITTFNEF